MLRASPLDPLALMRCLTVVCDGRISRHFTSVEMSAILWLRCSDLVPEQAHERQASETGDVVGGSGTITRLVPGTAGAPVFLRRADVAVAASLLRQLGTTPGRGLRDSI